MKADRRFIIWAWIIVPSLSGTGCGAWHHGIPDVGLSLPGFQDPAVPVGPASTSLEGLSNPLVVPVRDPEFTWNQIVDTVDDYFDIRSERRVERMGDILTEGRITTHPQPGATALEPWRWDSVPGFETAHATLQSVRRTATVRVLPTGLGYSIEVQVHKELEDVSTPSHATPGSAKPRHDRSLVSVENVDDDAPQTLGWIPMGRDIQLENEIIQEIHGRLVNRSGAPPPEVQWPF